MTPEEIQVLVAEEVKKQMPEAVSGYLDNLFRNPIVMDSFASNIFSRAVAAFHFRANHSQERVPVMVVSEQYIPGAIRAQLDDEGNLSVEEQPRYVTEKDTGWTEAKLVAGNDFVMKHLKDLVLSYDGKANKPYYIMDDISLENYRKSISDRLRDKLVEEGQIPAEAVAAQPEAAAEQAQ